MLAFREMLKHEADQIAGPKGKHQEQRTHHRWRTAATPLPFGGRNVAEQVVVGVPHLLDDQCDREHERHAPQGDPQRQALAR